MYRTPAERIKDDEPVKKRINMKRIKDVLFWLGFSVTVLGVLGAVGYGCVGCVRAERAADAREDRYQNEIRQTCKLGHFVDDIRVAEGLHKVTCMSNDGTLSAFFKEK